MLELCHRQGAIWYSWENSFWEYDLDRVFTEFASADYGQQLNPEFITRRLQLLPKTSRAILAWASLLGTSFSFRLVQRLLRSDEFHEQNDDVESDSLRITELSKLHPVVHSVEGLQAALQAYILMPGSTEDEYR